MLTRTIDFKAGSLRLLDQAKLPWEISYLECHTAEDVADAIRTMRVRGAPAIGVAVAYGMALGARECLAEFGSDLEAERFMERMRLTADHLKTTRPTAVNLAWALDRSMGVVELSPVIGPATTAEELLRLAEEMADEDEITNRKIGRYGSALLPEQANVLTHCNTGALATVAYGTALGVVRAAAEAGKRVHVLVDETRPYLQGARLTTWELQQLDIPFTLITDSMAGHFISRGQVDLVLVGADRIALNGDVANKIGTYALAVLCREHQIPFYVAAPTSTIDPRTRSGSEIPIEERSPEEVTHLGGQPIAPPGTRAAHPAFDVTPARLVSAIVTEVGVLRPPFEQALMQVVGQPQGVAAVART